MTPSAASMVIRAATPRDKAEVTRVVAAAFAGSPVARWLAPNEQDAAALITQIVDETVTSGLIQVVEDAGEIVGTALWTARQQDPPATGLYPPAPAAGGPGAVGRNADMQRRRRRLAFLAQTRRPQHQPYQMLTLLAVPAHRRRQGIGTYLLIGHHALTHLTGIGGYTVTDDGPRRHLLIRHGYTDIGPPQLLPDAEPIWWMWRPPGPADPL